MDDQTGQAPSNVAATGISAEEMSDNAESREPRRDAAITAYESQLANLQAQLEDACRRAGDVEDRLANSTSRLADMERWREIDLAKLRDLEVRLAKAEAALMTEQIMHANCAAMLRDYRAHLAKAKAELADVRSRIRQVGATENASL